VAQGFTIEFKGLDKVLTGLSSLGPKIKEEVGWEFDAAAQETVSIAQRLVPVDEAGLKNAVTKRKNGDNYEVAVLKNYAVYMEAGTKGNFKPFPGSEGYVSSFKPSGGTSKVSPIDALTGWVHRKGLAGTYSVKTQRRTGNKTTQSVQDRQLAWLIWRSIKKYGVKAHPFLFPAFFEVGDRLAERIKNIVADAVK
jgi:hypothetical protein